MVTKKPYYKEKVPLLAPSKSTTLSQQAQKVAEKILTTEHMPDLTAIHFKDFTSSNPSSILLTFN